MRALWLIYLVLLVLSVPWYWPAASGSVLVFGIPIWALVSLLCFLIGAIVTALVIQRVWQVELDAQAEDR